MEKTNHKHNNNQNRNNIDKISLNTASTNTNSNNNNNPEQEEEDEGLNYGNFLEIGRKLIEEKNFKFAEFYVTLANMEPKIDLTSKIKSIGILTFIRVNYKESQVLMNLLFKTEKFLKKYTPQKFEFNIVFCMIRVFYRGGLVKMEELDYITSLFFFRRARSLFEEGKVTHEEHSQKTISSCFEENVEKFKKDVNKINNNKNNKIIYL